MKDIWIFETCYTLDLLFIIQNEQWHSLHVRSCISPSVGLQYWRTKLLFDFSCWLLYWNRGCFDVCEDDAGDENPLDNDQQSAIKPSVETEEQEAERNDAEHFGQNISLPKPITDEPRRYLSGSLLPDNSFSSKKLVADVDR